MNGIAPQLHATRRRVSVSFAAALLLLLLFGAAAATTAGADDNTLSRRERKERTAKLAEVYRQFLKEVEPIMLPVERDAFLRLETDAQRDVFVDDFWRRRDLAAGTTNFAYRSAYEARLDFVRTHFEQISSDRGRLYLALGMPSTMVDINCPKYFQPIQIWVYDYIQGFGSNYHLLFYLPAYQRDYRLWNPMGGNFAYRELVATGIESAGRPPRNILIECPNGELLLKGLNQMSADATRIPKIFEPPPVNGEDVNRILRSVVLPDANAPKLNGTMQVSYPTSDGRKTDAQLSIAIPRSELKTTTVSGVSLYSLDVVGEVLRESKMWEKFRYRFDFPAEMQDATLPIIVDRPLKPGDYRARVKVTDVSSGAQAILDADLKVPELAAVQSEESKTLTSIQTELQSTRASVRIVPLGEAVASGLQTIQTMVGGIGIAAVEFWLDGKKIATRRAPPYTLDLDFGTVPRTRRIRVVALDRNGAPITGDELVANTGTDPFRVRIVSPRIAPKLSGPTRVEIDVRVPEGKKLRDVELYWNETKIATMYDAPFVQTFNVPKSDGVGYFRALATLDDPEADPIEDVVMVNTPEFMETLDVHLVELPTVVLADGKPVQNLEESSFRVLDAGQPAKIAKFEYVKDLPLSVGMAIDTSGSMTERMTVARDAGAAFFKNVLRTGDKAFLVAFDSQPHMVQKWSPNLNEIFTGLAKLRPEESTALYDAVVYSLYNFVGVKGQKALVLVTDGKDTASKFTFDQALEYAQRASVPVYTIGISIRPSDMDVRSKLNRFASETGGTAFYIDDAKDLVKVYDAIQAELRSQYIIGFYPPAEVKVGGKWREVSVENPAGKVRTIRGYYP